MNEIEGKVTSSLWYYVSCHNNTFWWCERGDVCLL